MTDSSGLQHTDLVVEPEGEPEWTAAIPPRPALIPAETPAGLSQAARQALPDTLSENTKRVYRSALQSLNERLAGRCVCDEHLSEVLAEMSAERLSEFTLRVAVAAVNKEAELAGLESPCGRSTTTVLKAHARKAPPPQQVTAVWAVRRRRLTLTGPPAATSSPPPATAPAQQKPPETAQQQTAPEQRPWAGAGSSHALPGGASAWS